MADHTDTWDVIVIGGGPPGENAAQYAIADSDRTAVIVEQELVGGDCSYWACMPSKGLLRPIEVLEAARTMPGASAAVTGRLDVEAVLERRDRITNHHDDRSQVSWAEGIGVDVVRGVGRLSGERAVTVTGSGGTERVLRARHAVVLATGTTPTVPPVPGLAEALPWTSRDVTNLHEVPRRVAVVGGGVVACESATWLRGLGAEEVTLIESAPALLSRQEPFASEMVARRFDELGITVLTSTRIDRVERGSPEERGEGRIHGGPAILHAGDRRIEVDEVVIAAGRTPASSDLGLDVVGIDPAADRGFVTVDDHLTVAGVAGDWLYAVGDLCGRALLTHMGKYQARIAGDVISARAEGRPLDGSRYRDLADHDMVPAVVFSDPQIASVGLTEAVARQRGLDVEVLDWDLGAIAGATLVRDGYEGHARLVVDRGRDTLVGATFVGYDVAELLHSATTAIVGKVPLETLWHVVPSYPTISEIWLRLLESRR